MMGKTVVIIGAGLGGLFTGAILAKEGLLLKFLRKPYDWGRSSRLLSVLVKILIRECISWEVCRKVVMSDTSVGT